MLEFTENVPADIKAFATWFVTYYGINGICDPMYVANITALELNRGDGKSKFGRGLGNAGDREGRVQRLTNRLRESYGVSITESGKSRAYVWDVVNALTRQPRRMICACCDSGTIGRQWWNRDNGFGLCKNCVDFCRRGCDDDDMFSSYGAKGIHYAIEGSESEE